jgi:hypothetical protein
MPPEHETIPLLEGPSVKPCQSTPAPFGLIQRPCSVFAYSARAIVQSKVLGARVPGTYRHLMFPVGEWKPGIRFVEVADADAVTPRITTAMRNASDRFMTDPIV